MKLKLCSYINAKLWCHGSSTVMSWWLRQPLLAKRAGVSPCTCLRLQGKVSWLRCQKSLGMVGVYWDNLGPTESYLYCNARVRLWSVQIFQDPFLAEVIAIGQQACVWMLSASVVALLSVQRGKRHFACWAKCQDCNCNPMLLSFI